MSNSLVEKIKREFSRTVPAEYTHLIERAKGQATENMYGREIKLDPIFFDISQAIAHGTVLSYQDNIDEFARKARGKDFLDLGFGNVKFPIFLKNLKYESVAEFAKASGAIRYIGVDLSDAENQSRDVGNFPIVYVKDEILSFLSSIPDGNKHPTSKLFFLSGLESPFRQEAYDRPIREDGELSLDMDIPARYHEALYNEIKRVTKPGDIVYIGGRTKSIEPVELVNRGFKDPGHVEGKYFGGDEANEGFYERE